MNIKQSKLLTLLPLLPLLMATSPLPPRVPRVELHDGVEVTLLEKSNDIGTTNGKKYKLRVKNSGDGYLSSVVLRFPKEVEKDSRYTSFNTEIFDLVSDSQVFAPNQEFDCVVYANYDAESINEFVVEAFGYSQFVDEIKISGTRELTSFATNEDNNRYLNHVEMSFGGKVSGYVYGAIIKVKHGINYYYFEVNEAYGPFTFYTDMALPEGEVEVVKIIKSKYDYDTNNYGIEPQRKLDKLPYFIIAFSIVIGLSILGLITFVIVRSIKKAHK